MGRLIPFPSVADKEPKADLLWPRLLTRSQAAAYCGLTTAAFIKACPLVPVNFGQDKHSERFDRYELDAWIDRNCEASNQNGWLDWLALMEGKAS